MAPSVPIVAPPSFSLFVNCRQKANLNTRNFNKSDYASGNWLRWGWRAAELLAAGGSPVPVFSHREPHRIPFYALPVAVATFATCACSGGQQLQPLNQTPLHIAAEGGDVEMADMLLK